MKVHYLFFIALLTLSEALSLKNESRATGCFVDLGSVTTWPALSSNRPIFMDEFGDLVRPTLLNADWGFRANTEEVFFIACTGLNNKFKKPWTQGSRVITRFQAICRGNNKWQLFEADGVPYGNAIPGFGAYDCMEGALDQAAIVKGNPICGPIGKQGTEVRIHFDAGLAVGEATTVKLCLDAYNAVTLWTVQNLGPEIIAMDKTRNENWNMDVDFYNDPDTIPDLAALFAQPCTAGTIQYETLKLIVGDKVKDYLNTGCCLQRGHLEARSHFVFRSWQKSTYHLMNTAPAWGPFDGGNWKITEDKINNKFESNNWDMNVGVYTGTSGVLRLKDDNNNLVEIYLCPEDKTGCKRNRMPVPKYMWKMIVKDKTSQSQAQGVVIVGHNNPFLEEGTWVHPCTPVTPAHEITIGLDADTAANRYKGITIACKIDDAANAFPELKSIGLSSGIELLS